MIRNKIGILLLLPASAILFLVLNAFELKSVYLNQATSPEETLVIPEEINLILDKSCFGCHNTESTSDKAKNKLLLDELTGLSKAKLIGKLGEMAETVKENEMPPKKFLENYPDKALTAEERQKLTEWAEKAADQLLD
jgi:hypothetical protein